MPEPRAAAHRLLAFWFLATAPLLALPGEHLALRLGLLSAHVAVGTVFLIPGFHEWASRQRPGVLQTVYDWLPLLIAPALYWEVPVLTGVLHGDAHFDSVVLGWEAALFGGQPSRSLAALGPWLWLSEPLHAAYLSFYFFIIAPPVVLQWVGRRDALRQVVFTLVLAALAHAVVFTAFPVLGPRYLFPPPGGGLEAGPLYRLTHLVLERGSSPGTAFPSSHVGIAVAVTIAVWRGAPWAGVVLAPVAAALALATVYGGFHYAVDAVAGASLGATVAVAAPALRRRLAGQSVRAPNVSQAAGSPVS